MQEVYCCMELTGKQWVRIEPVILQSSCKKDSRGRKPRVPREVLNGILSVLRTGEPWKDCLTSIAAPKLPSPFPGVEQARQA